MASFWGGHSEGSVGKGPVRVTKLEDNSNMGPDHLEEEAERRGGEQCGEKGVELGTGLGENFSFPFKGTSPTWGILTGKL